MTVRVPTAEIEREVAARLAKVGKTAKLKGFRPGKIPKNVVRQYYGGQIRDEVLSDVIRSSYSRAIAEHKLNPAGGPRIEPVTDASSEHFIYRATFEVYPEIELAPLEDISIEKPKRRDRGLRRRGDVGEAARAARRLASCRAPGRDSRPRRRRFRRQDRR